MRHFSPGLASTQLRFGPQKFFTLRASGANILSHLRSEALADRLHVGPRVEAEVRGRGRFALQRTRCACSGPAGNISNSGITNGVLESIHFLDPFGGSFSAVSKPNFASK